MDELEISQHSSSSGASRYTTRSSVNGAQAMEHKDETAQTRIVRISRLVVFLIIFAGAAALSYITFQFVQDTEMKEFKDAFESHASKVIAAIEEDISLKITSSEVLSSTLSAHAKASQSPWPFVTLPFYNTIGRRINELSKAEMTFFLPAVTDSLKSEWISYSVQNQGWVMEGLIAEGVDDPNPGPIPPIIWTPPTADGDSPGFAVPLWQTAPAPRNATIVNVDLDQSLSEMFTYVLQSEHALLAGKIRPEPFLILAKAKLVAPLGEPRQLFLHPVYKEVNHEYHKTEDYRQRDPVKQIDTVPGFIMSIVPWKTSLVDKLPNDISGLYVNIKSPCDVDFTYQLDGSDAIYLGEGDFHEAAYTKYGIKRDISNGLQSSREENGDIFALCGYEINVYPSAEFEDIYVSTSSPWRLTLMVASAFIFTAIAFLLYDLYITRQKQKIEAKAKKTGAIVDSLFPKQVQKRMLEEHEANERPAKNPFKRGEEHHINNETIADFFPEVTILFGDIVGFTAWSSTREPQQVFTLLEKVFSTFDKIAKQRRIFKVETVGDCYVAAAGIPTARKDHAVAMARFARDCQYAFIALTRELEVQLGPDTAELGMRFGLHSGPITAGVLRGDGARFQLFGDTMNTASRIESNGMKNKIHLSNETASKIIEAGKSHWLVPRKDKIVAKGKGEMQTYFLEIKGDSAKSASDNSEASGFSDSTNVYRPTASTSVKDAQNVKSSDKQKEGRLINWNKEVLAKQLAILIAHRGRNQNRPGNHQVQKLEALEMQTRENRGIVLDEVKEVVSLATTNVAVSAGDGDIIENGLDETVDRQLLQYVETIAAMYQSNPFHNFEHASHVTMSVTKLLARIVTPSSTSSITDNSYGIPSDPMVHFAVTFSALIHDVDHPGIPNTQMIKERSGLASIYKNRSIAEQNSVDLAWQLLMDPEFVDLRRSIYTTTDEFQRFRQLVVNTVMATDIMDKDLKQLRNDRWAMAFSTVPTERNESIKHINDRKATIVIEHLIQASDVAHTMQHWHIYRKWNERLFEELFKAFHEGRAESNPADFWYKGEMGFFDFYIIPLAKKLKECGVFGVSSDEYLTYALRNREEWEHRGAGLVAEMTENVLAKYGGKVSVLEDTEASTSLGSE